MIADGQAGLNRLYAMVWPPKPAPQNGIPFPATLSPDADEVLDRAFKAANGQETARLYAGDLCGHPSESEARAALLHRLIFWTRDPHVLESLLRESGRDSSRFDKRRGAETFAAYEVQRALSSYRGATYDPARAVVAPKPLTETAATRSTSTEDRLAALEAEVAELKRTVRIQQEVIETQRGRLQLMELEAQAVRNAKLKAAAPALVAIARKVEEIRSLTTSERRDEEGYCRLYVGSPGEEGSLADDLKLSGDSISRYIDLGERAGLLQRKYIRELREVVDQDGVIKTVPIKQVWVSYDGTLTDQLQRIAAYNPAPEDRARVVNKPTCPRHPGAKVIVFKTYKCAECGDTIDMRPSDDPEDDGDSYPQPAVTNPSERGGGSYTQLAVRTVPMPDWPTDAPEKPTTRNHWQDGTP